MNVAGFDKNYQINGIYRYLSNGIGYCLRVIAINERSFAIALGKLYSIHYIRR